MKKFILIFVTIFLSISLFGQTIDPIEFMGIPVDGTVANMKSKLIAKGFKYNATLDGYIGEFNGENVEIYILSNKGKVWRIAVYYYKDTDQNGIKRKFNRLLNQFNNNDKYPYVYGEEIPSNEYLYSHKIKELEYSFTAYQRLFSESYVSCILYTNTYGYCIWLYYDNNNNKANGEDL